MNNGDVRFLIVNADDFGLSPGVNRGVIQGHRRGMITSTSLMVRKDWARQAVRLAAGCPDLSLGLHLDLGEWRFKEGEWVADYLSVDLASERAVKEEMFKQLRLFQEITGTNPTHVDSHQHVHMSPSIRPLAVAFAGELGVPLRRCAPGPQYCDKFYGQTAEGNPLPDRITPAALIEIIRSLSPGWTELACHPADAEDTDAVYRQERLIELKTLCDPSVQAALRQEPVVLCSFQTASAPWRTSWRSPRSPQ